MRKTVLPFVSRLISGRQTRVRHPLLTPALRRRPSRDYIGVRLLLVHERLPGADPRALSALCGARPKLWIPWLRYVHLTAGETAPKVTCWRCLRVTAASAQLPGVAL